MLACVLACVYVCAFACVRVRLRARACVHACERMCVLRVCVSLCVRACVCASSALQLLSEDIKLSAKERDGETTVRRHRMPSGSAKFATFARIGVGIAEAYPLKESA